MKRTLLMLLSMVVLAGFVSSTYAGAKKREPNKHQAENVIKAIGGEHYPEGVEFDDLGRVSTSLDEETEGNYRAYYWIFIGELPDHGGYLVYIFDNSPPEGKYLGFYATSLEPAETGKEFISFAVEDQGSDDPKTGRPDRKSIDLTAKGPVERLRIAGIGGNECKFVPAPEPEEEEEEPATTTSTSTSSNKKKQITPEYRTWHVTLGSNVIEVESAIFVSYKNGLVTIKDGKTGRTVSKPLRDFSKEDQAYLKKLLQ